jgi:hypothetical protein
MLRLPKALLILATLSGIACSACEREARAAVGNTSNNDTKRATLGVFQPGAATFALRKSLTSGFGEISIQFGKQGDIPIAGDWDGDGRTTVGTYRPSDNTFYLRNDNTDGPADVTVAFGKKDDLPVVGDWDGNGTVTIGTYRPIDSTFRLRNSNSPG